MDNIISYQDQLSKFGAGRQAVKDKANQELEEKRQKLREFTDPFEQLGIDDFSDLFKVGVKSVGKKLLSKVGLTEEKAKQYKDAFDKNGAKGVMQKLAEDRPQLGSKSVPQVGAREPLQLSGDIDTSANVEDLLPKEFDAIKGTANRAIKSELSNLEPIDRLNFASKFNELKSTANFAGDIGLKQQYNLQAARKALDFAQGGGEAEEGAISIASMKPTDFRELQPILKGSIEAEKSQLHPAYRSAFDNLMNDRVATKGDIPDDLLRSKFNLHQEARSLDDIKNLSPSELAPLPNVEMKSPSSIIQQIQQAGQSVKDQASKTLQQVSSIGKTTAGDAKDFEDGVIGQAKKSITNVFKTGENIGSSVGKTLDATGESIGKAVLKSGEKGLEDAGKIATAAGGEEDIIGDVVGAGVGLATFLGGIFGARHIHKAPLEAASNFSYQMGA